MEHPCVEKVDTILRHAIIQKLLEWMNLPNGMGEEVGSEEGNFSLYDMSLSVAPFLNVCHGHLGLYPADRQRGACYPFFLLEE